MTFSAPLPPRLAHRASVTDRATQRAEARKYVFLLLDQFTHLAFSCAIEPLRLANHAAQQPLYTWQTCSESGNSAQASNGISVLVDSGLSPLGGRETLVIVGGKTPRQAISQQLLGYLRRRQAHGVKIVGICSATSVLALAGLIENQSCAVHWELSDAFAELHPGVRVVDGTFTLDQVPTAAGGAAVADLMLHLIGLDHGTELAGRVADLMVYSGIRGPQAPQTTSLQARYGMRSRPLAAAIRLMEANLEEPLCMGDVAKAAGLSVRQMERLFARHLDESPNRHYIALRMSKARNLLTQTEMPVIDIALACGFISASHFSKKYREHFGQSAHQNRASGSSAAL